MLQCRWSIPVLFLLAAGSCLGRDAAAFGGGEPVGFLSTLTGTYTHFLDDDLSVTMAYDLADDSNVPTSFLTG